MPTIEVSEAHSQDAAPAASGSGATTQQAMLKNAVQSRYFALLEGGSSPNAAAANAIRDVGNKATTLWPGEKVASDSASDDYAPRHLRFEDSPSPTTDEQSPVPEEHHGGRMQLSSSAPTLSMGNLSRGRESTQLIGGGRGSSPAGGHRNKDVWKTFGIHLPAGRLLKNLYGGGKVDPVPGTLKQALPRRFGPPSELDTYMAVNNMNMGTPGLQYRKSMNIFDICKGAQDYVRWGDSVEGYRVDASWLQVGDRYLPTTVNKIQLLRRWRGPEALRAEGLKRQQSLPPLRKVPKDRPNPHLTVGGVAYGF